MNINVLQREFQELLQLPELFDAENFRARKEALEFIGVINALLPHGKDDVFHLQEKASEFGRHLLDFNRFQFENFTQRLNEEKPSVKEFFSWISPRSSYISGRWGLPHYGYEDIDFLLDGVLTPEPHPVSGLQREYGMLRYEPTPTSVILELIERVSLSKDSVFCDVGSGLGKVTSLVYLLSRASCVGVEYQPEFYSYANEQSQRLGLVDIRYLNLDARNADYSNVNVFFLFNPFGGEIFDAVLEKIRKDVHSRQITICSYGNSSRELRDLGWLRENSPYAQDEMSLAIFHQSF